MMSATFRYKTKIVLQKWWLNRAIKVIEACSKETTLKQFGNSNTTYSILHCRHMCSCLNLGRTSYLPNLKPTTIQPPANLPQSGRPPRFATTCCGLLHFLDTYRSLSVSTTFPFHLETLNFTKMWWDVLCCAVFICSLFLCKNMLFWQKNKFALVKSQVCLGNYAIQFCAPIRSLFFANIFKGLSTFQIANNVD